MADPIGLARCTPRRARVRPNGTDQPAKRVNLAQGQAGGMPRGHGRAKSISRITVGDLPAHRPLAVIDRVPVSTLPPIKRILGG